MRLVYGIDGHDGSIVFSEEVLIAMQQYRQIDFHDKEAGGQLFAKFEGNKTIIVEATEPKRLDKRTRYGFIPNRWIQSLEIKAKHRQGKHFVGDWHTHPEPIPSPSIDDINGMVECYRESQHELKKFVMVILGTANLPDGLFVCLVDACGITGLTCRSSIT